MKKIFLALFLVFFIGITGVFSACTFTNPYTYELDSGFEVSSMQVTIDVKEDRRAEVEEIITVKFLQSRRGIIRDLPINSGEVYENITLEGDKYFITTSRNFISVNTGTSDNERDVYYQKGETKIYTIKYTIIPPKKTFNSDNYYMNVIGQGWATTIYNASVKVTFPFDISEYEVYYGKWGETNTASSPDSSVTASKSGKQLSITTDKLFAYNGITIDCSLNGKLGSYFNYKAFLAILISVAILVLFIILKFFKRRTEIIEVVNFYPPSLDGRQLNPAETGLLIDSTCDASDITALIFHWASKGNLLIEGEKKDLTLIKLMDLDDSAPNYEKDLYNKIFASSNRVTIKSLENKIYVQIQKAQTSVRNKYKGKLYKHLPISVFVSVIAVLLTGVSYYFFGLNMNKAHLTLNGFKIALPIIIMYTLGSTLLRRKRKLKKSTVTLSYLVYALTGVVASVLSIIVLNNGVPLSARIALICSSITISMISPFFVDYTPFYAEILGEIAGFKNFLVSAEKGRLEALLEDNPQYYYNILPYANVLGVSDIWQDKFKGLTVIPPTYYRSTSGMVFDIIIFNALYRNMFNSIRATTISRPSGKSGGGFGGGGGFSGGGFGGGGGRSR